MIQPEFFTLWHVQLDGGDIGPRRLDLLQAIEITGSISQSAKKIGMTYKAAWDAVDIMNNLAGTPLVRCQHGGKGGGGATLTQTGSQIVRTYERLLALQAKWITSLDDGVQVDVLPLIRRLSMKTSARNMFYGVIESIDMGLVNVEVILKLQGETRIAATITLGSLEQMQLKVGDPAWALVKASWVILASSEVQGKTSARNCLCGEIIKIIAGQVNVEVIVQLEGGNTVSAVVTKPSLENLKLELGSAVCALIKSSQVLIGVDG